MNHFIKFLVAVLSISFLSSKSLGADWTKYEQLLKNLKEGKVFKKDSVVKWKCRNCGYIHEGKEAPKECPACAHSQSYYELFCENY